jgi:hypothetical protein
VTQANHTAETPINVFHLESAVVERVLEDLLTKTWNLLSGALQYFFHDLNEKFLFLGRVKGIRSFHQFNWRNDGTILCRRTSNSVDHDTCTLRYDDNEDNQEPELSLRSVKTLRDIAIDKFVIIEHDNKGYLAQVSAISHVHQEVDVQCYKPAFPHASYLASYNKIRGKLTLEWHKIIGSIVDQPASGRRMQLLLSKEQFNDIHSFCN